MKKLLLPLLAGIMIITSFAAQAMDPGYAYPGLQARQATPGAYRDVPQPAPGKMYNLPNQVELDRQLMDAFTVYAIDPNKIEKLLQEGANPDGGQFKQNEHKPLFTIIYRAKDKRIALCKLFLDHGVDVDGLDNCGHATTPLLAAAQLDCVEIANLLLEHKANVNCKHKLSGFSPIHFACSISSNPELVKILLEHKANVNDQSNTIQISPLMRATLPYFGFPKTETCTMLLANKADNLAVCRDGDTALIKAARRQNKPICRLLVSAAKKPSILAFLTCLRHTDRTNTLYRRRNEFFHHHFRNGKPVELLRKKNKGEKTAFDLLPLAWLDPVYTSSDYAL